MPESLVIASIVVGAVVTLAVLETEVRSFIIGASKRAESEPSIDVAREERHAA